MTYMTKPMDENRRAVKVAVIGGGPAGMMASITAAENGAETTLFEKNDRLGKKLRITGKGRCNVTNDCDTDEFLQNVPTNSRFLYTALSGFSTADTKAFFESLGVPLKVERGKRVFPVSDKAADIADAMKRGLDASGVRIRHAKVRSIVTRDGAVTGIAAGQGEEEFDRVIVCTGGLSYPLTGSDGDGYRFAEDCGHTVTELRPSLVPITVYGTFCRQCQGLSLKNVAIEVIRKKDGKTVYEDFGEMMFTHFGLTGPMILSASAHLPDLGQEPYELRIDLKPALDAPVLDERIRTDFSKYINKDFINALDDLLPQKIIEPLVALSGIDPRTKVHSVTKEQRESFVRLLKGIPVELKGFRPIDEAIVTKGGVSVKDVFPKSMESRLVRGLYFAGEVLDLDAYTGGFNLQIAFSTGHLAGENAAKLD